MADVNNTNTTPEAKQFLDKAGLDALVNQIKINFSTKDELNNKDFYDIVNNPVVNSSTDKFVIADKQGNIGLRLDVDNNLYVNDIVAGNDVLSNKADKDEVNNKDFYDIVNNPVVNSSTDKFVIADKQGNIGLRLDVDNNLYVNDIVAGNDVLSNKADKDDIPSLEGYATEEFVTDKINNLDFNNVPDKIELINISGNLLDDSPIYTISEIKSIINAYDVNKLIAIKSSTNLAFGKGWFIPNIQITKQEERYYTLYVSGIIGRYYIEHNISYDSLVGTISTTVNSNIDLSNIGSGDSGNSCSCNYPDANVQSVDTGDIIDGVEVEYATKTYVDTLIGNINSILENLINNS